MKVKDAMHKGVEWVGPDTPVTELSKLMCKHDVGAVPIGENDRLIAMVTDRDIVCKGLAEDILDVRRATARDVMTPGIHCCRDDDDLAKAVRHMEALKVRRLPVINKSKRMVSSVWAMSAIRHPAICCPNASRAFRPITTKHTWCHSPGGRLMPAGRVWADHYDSEALPRPGVAAPARSLRGARAGPVHMRGPALDRPLLARAS